MVMVVVELGYLLLVIGGSGDVVMVMGMMVVVGYCGVVAVELTAVVRVTVFIVVGLLYLLVYSWWGLWWC